MTIQAGLLEQVLSDPARGTRRLWRDADGTPVRLELADGTALRVRRDDEAGSIAVTDGDGRVLVDLSAPVAIPALVRAMGLTPAQAAGIDGCRRLTATDPGGTTRTELRDRTVRVERDGAVLRIDTDDAGRPRRVAVPGFGDLEVRWSGGAWEVSRIGGPVLLQVDETDGRTAFRSPACTWAEERAGRRAGWSDAGGHPVVATELDQAGRVVAREWHGGRRIEYERDERMRLTRWADARPGENAVVHERRYAGADLAALVAGGTRIVARGDGSGRVRKLIGPHRTVTYDHDPNGRRTARRAGSEATAYRYDPLGQLVAVVGPRHSVEYGWDALGRRLSVTVDGAGYREHRDPSGRLWSVTTADGEPVCAFLWWDGRVVARCGATGEVDEAYLTDPFGTLLGIASEATGWRFGDAIQPPFGAVTRGAGWRPTLFGHIADGVSGLIPFGARELDPETGLFLTPDPWHGEADDPRLMAGQRVEDLPAEAPAAGVHPYALGQGDPLAHPDVDGHFAVLPFLLTLTLGPTWGAALTSLSIFLFTPLNLYMEVIGQTFGRLFNHGHHPWPQHSIFGLRGLSGSSRLGTFGLALNGFFPRAMAGLGGDRCITIGHVVWESRHYFQMLDRARVLELDDVAGTPSRTACPAPTRAASPTPGPAPWWPSRAPIPTGGPGCTPAGGPADRATPWACAAAFRPSRTALPPERHTRAAP